MLGLGIKSLGIYALPPTITGINVDFASSGGGESRIITGTNFTNAVVTVDGYSATITGQTATTITFTTPASGVDTTNGNSTVSVVKVATPGGYATTSGAPGNSLWYVPKYLSVTGCGVWSAQNVTTSGSNIATVVDLSGNGNTMSASSTAPVYHNTGGGSSGNLPYWSNSTTGYLSAANFTAVVQPFELIYAVRFTSTSTIAPVGFPGTTAGTQTFELYNSGNGLIDQNAGSANANGVAATINTDFWIDALYSGSSSLHSINGGTAVSGTNPGTATPPIGMYIGNARNTGYYWLGYHYCVFIYPAALNSTKRGNFAAYFSNQGL